MHPIDSLAPLAINVLILLGLIMLAIELVGTVRRHHRRSELEVLRDLHRRHH